MSAQSTVRVIMANMLLKVAAFWGYISLVAASGTSLTSVSNLHGGSYAYGVDHDSYDAWYGAAHPHPYSGLSIGHESLDEGHHGSLYEHAQALPQGHYGYATYGSGYDHGAYATSYQKLSKSYDGEKVLHAGHAVHHGHGATSYSKIVQKFGHGLYDGHDLSHNTYAGGYGHNHAGNAISTQNFNLKSYVHPPIHVEHIPNTPIHETISYAPHHETHAPLHIDHAPLHEAHVPIHETHTPLHETYTPHHESHAPLLETYSPYHKAIPYIPAHSYSHAPEDITSTYTVHDHDHGHQSLGDFYGLGDYSHLLNYGHGHEHVEHSPHAFYTYGIPHNSDSYGNYAPYGYGHGLSFYHR